MIARSLCYQGRSGCSPQAGALFPKIVVSFAVFLYFLWLAVRVQAASSNCSVLWAIAQGIVLMSFAGFLVVWFRFLRASGCQRLVPNSNCQERAVFPYNSWVHSAVCRNWQVLFVGGKTEVSLSYFIPVVFLQ